MQFLCRVYFKCKEPNLYDGYQLTPPGNHTNCGANASLIFHIFVKKGLSKGADKVYPNQQNDLPTIFLPNRLIKTHTVS